MGLDDKADMLKNWIPLLAPVCQRPREAPADLAEPPNRGPRADFPTRCDSGPLPSSTTNERLQRRIEALESWAHLIDGQLETDEHATDTAIFRASELLDAMARQAVQDALTQNRDDTIDRLNALEAGTWHCSTVSALVTDVEALQAKVDMIMNLGHSTRTSPAPPAQDLAAKIASLEH
eukprot:1447107-Amphidinium_carterae.1